MNNVRPTITLADIEGKAKNYRGARDILADRVRQLTQQIEDLRRDADPLIRSALQTARAAESELSNAISGNVALFKRPRSYVFHGVRVGIEKGKGIVQIEDSDRTVQLIRKHFESDFDLLVKTQRTPIKKAIEQLPAADLKRIGVQVIDATDQVLIRPVDSELDKMLTALLKVETERVEEDADA